MVKAQEWKRTKAVIKRMKKSTEKSQLQYEMGLALAQAQKWEQAEAMIYTIREYDKRAIARDRLCNTAHTEVGLSSYSNRAKLKFEH